MVRQKLAKAAKQVFEAAQKQSEKKLREVVLLTRSTCHLSRAARFIVRKCQTKFPFELKMVDILDPEADSYWYKWRADAPVVLLDGRIISKHKVDEFHILRELRMEPGPPTKDNCMFQYPIRITPQKKKAKDKSRS